MGQLQERALYMKNKIFIKIGSSVQHLFVIIQKNKYSKNSIFVIFFMEVDKKIFLQHV